MKKNIYKYLIAAAIGALIALLVMGSRGAFTASAPSEVIRFVSDGLFASAVMLCGVGLLAWIGGTGFFDIMGYGVNIFFSMFTPLGGKSRQEFYEYKQEKKKKRGKTPLFILWVGLGYLFLAVVFTVLFFVVPAPAI